MPLLNSEPWTPLLTPPDKSLLFVRFVYQIRFTGEIFQHYDDYWNCLSQYRKTQWTCARTLVPNLTLEEAILSERAALGKNKTFPKALQLRAMQLLQQTCGRLSDLADLMMDHFRQNPFVPGEILLCDDGCERYKVKILQQTQNDNKKRMAETLYKVQKKSAVTEMSIPAKFLSRDETIFNKNKLVDFLRSIADKDHWLGALWTIRKDIMEKHNISLKPDQEFQQMLNDHNNPNDSIDPTIAKKPKIVKYPIEDLYIPSSGRMATPLKSLESVDFQLCAKARNGNDCLIDSSKTAELLVIYQFLTTFGSILNLYPFSWDDFLEALLTDTSQGQKALMVEILFVLITSSQEERKARAIKQRQTNEALIKVRRIETTPERDNEQENNECPIEKEKYLDDEQNCNHIEVEFVAHKWWNQEFTKKSNIETTLIECQRENASLQELPNLDAILTDLNSLPKNSFPQLSSEWKCQILSFLVYKSISSPKVKGYIELSIEYLSDTKKKRRDTARKLRDLKHPDSHENSLNTYDDHKRGKSPFSENEDMDEDEMKNKEDDNYQHAQEEEMKEDADTTDVKVMKIANESKNHRIDELNSIDHQIRMLERHIRLKSLGFDRWHREYWYFDYGTDSETVKMLNTETDLKSRKLLDIYHTSPKDSLADQGYSGVLTGRVFVEIQDKVDMNEVTNTLKEAPLYLQEEYNIQKIKDQSWQFIGSLSELTEFMDTLNEKGIRELELMAALMKEMPLIRNSLEKQVSAIKKNEDKSDDSTTKADSTQYRIVPTRVTRNKGASTNKEEIHLEGYRYKNIWKAK